MSTAIRRPAAWCALALALLACGCGPARRAASRFTWVVGQGCPAFDPQGPPDPVRAALERMCSRGLVDRDTSGALVPMAAERWDVSADSLRWTFHLRGGLRFTDGTPCTSADFAHALTAGLTRRDHSTTRWLLAALAGVNARGRHADLTAGITTPDANTIELRLTRPDRHLLAALARPGVAVPWHGGGGGAWGVGLGPYSALERSDTRWLLARFGPVPWSGPAGFGADTLEIRFVVGAARMHALLRAQVPDLAWPLPPGWFALPMPDAYRAIAREATPPLRLLLVLRPDLPPTTKPAARHALVHGLNRSDIVAQLGPRAGAPPSWLVGGHAFEFPARSEQAVRDWMDQGDLGRSFHVAMAYSADGPAAEVARAMQQDWAQLGLDVELQPTRAVGFGARALAAAGAQLTLCEEQALLDEPAAELAGDVMPMRDPPVGAFRTGWRTREFDPWIGPDRHAPVFDRDFAERRLGEEDIVLPLAGTRWVWLERMNGPSAPFDPRFGPAGHVPTGVTTAAHKAGRR